MDHNIIALALLAFIPVIVMFYMGYLYPMAWIQVVPAGLTVTALLAFYVWRMTLPAMMASLIQGFILSAQHLILLAAICLFTEVLRATGSVDSMRTAFARMTSDKRIQAILVAWFLGSFLEGLMGFTFTGAVIALMLMGLGFPPACSIMLAMMGPVTASAFSCAGTPILFNVFSSLQQSDIMTQIAASHATMGDFLHKVGAYVGVIHGIAGTFMPLMMVMMMTHFYGEKKSWKEALDLAPFAIFSGLAFTIPYMLTAIFLGPQFPSLIGALVGLAVATTALGMKFLVPARKWHFPKWEKWEPAWSEGTYQKPKPSPKIPIWLTWSPVVILFLLLAVSQIPNSWLGNFLKSQIFKAPHFLGTPVALFAHPFFMPASVLIIAASGITLVIHHFKHANRIFNQRHSHFLARAGFNLPFTMPMMCLYFNSGINKSGYPGMVESLAQTAANLPLPHAVSAFLTPLLGVAGTNFASSGMHSAMMFSSYQYHLGQNLIGGGALFIALHVSGAMAGNLFAGHYLDGISLHAGKEGLSGPIGRKVLWPMFAYLAMVGIVGAIATSLF